MSTFDLEAEVTAYLPLLTGLAYTYAKSCPGLPVNDLISAGHEALVQHCLPTFDPSKGKLSTYAYRPVGRAMLKCMARWRRDNEQVKEIDEGEQVCHYTHTPDYHACRMDDIRRVRSALNKLKKEEIDLLLTAVEDTRKAAAEHAGLDTHNASYHFNKALRRLRLALNIRDYQVT